MPAFAQRGGSMRAGDSFNLKKVAEWRGSAVVSGKVTDEAGKGIAEARVTFIFAKANDGFFATTKKNGEYSANDIKAGLWKVQVDAPNFVTVKQDLTVEDKKNSFNVTLKRDNAPELLTQADALFKAGKNADARAEYMKVLTAHPELAGINRAIAFTHGREGNHAEALKYLDLALAGNPNDPVLLQLAHATAIDLQDYTRAAAYVARIDESTLTDPSLLLNSAVALLKQRRNADAIVVLGRVIARFPDAPDAYFYRGYAFVQLGRSVDAKPDLEKYLALAPDGPQAANAKELLGGIK